MRTEVLMHLDHNRPFIDVQCIRPDGHARPARFWVDTGGGAFIVTEPLARELGLPFLTHAVRAPRGGDVLATIPVPSARVGHQSLDLKDVDSFVRIGQRTIYPGVDAEGLLPGRVLARYHVIFDYPGRSFTLAEPGTCEPRGTCLPITVHATSGFPRVEIEVDGERHGMLLDTGASCTMMSRPLLDHWAASHLDWPRAIGAVGAANMGLGKVEAEMLLLRVADVTWDSMNVDGVAMVSRPAGTFEEYMSQMTDGAIAGALGGNLLKSFRLEIDYANGSLYAERQAELDPHDMDLVGLVLQFHADEPPTVAGTASTSAIAARTQVHAGDRLVAVDTLPVRGLTLGQTIDALRGNPGEVRELVLERQGEKVEVSAPVTRIV